MEFVCVFPGTFLQATSDKTASANFTQTGKSTNIRGIANNLTNKTNGYNPYYQWGRKDAFRSAQYTTAPAAGTTLIFSDASVKVGATIKNPTTFYAAENETIYYPYINSLYYNAWNATCTTYSREKDNIDILNKAEKTVYDPCPVGYTVPPANTFSGISAAAAPVSGQGRLYTSASGAKVYFPFVGRRTYNTGVLSDVGSLCVYSVAVVDQFLCRTLYADEAGINNFRIAIGGQTYMSTGYPIRPIREK